MTKKTWENKKFQGFSLAAGLALSMGVIEAKAAQAVTISVPFTWTLNQTTGPGKSDTSTFVDNNGPIGNVKSDSNALGGSFTIDFMHTPPQDTSTMTFTRLDDLPTQVDLKITGSFTGTFSNTTLGLNIQGIPFETFIKTSGKVSASGGTLEFPEEHGGASAGDINQTDSFIISVGKGSTSYTGSVNTQTKFGFGLQNLDFVTVFSKLTVNGELLNSNTNIRYEKKTVPEPLTILGSSMALGFGALFKKEYSRKQKKVKNLVKQKA